jgi:hypothetical protein
MGLLVLAVGAAAAACSIDDIYGGVIGVDDGAGAGVSKSQRVDGSSETRIELKTHAAVTVPEDAVETPVEIGMERPSDEKAVSLVRSLKDYQAIVSAPYVLTPHGTKFREPVTIEIPVTKQTDKKLVVGWLENESDKNWKMLGEPVVKDGIAKLAIDHFSVVILLEEERANLADDEGDGEDPLPVLKDAGPGSLPPSGLIDASVRLPDAGSAGLDAGSAPFNQDAATQPPKDAGAAGPDGGTGMSVDAGAIDAGSAPVDSGADAGDAGDAGKGPNDSGNDAAG